MQMRYENNNDMYSYIRRRVLFMIEMYVKNY